MAIICFIIFQILFDIVIFLGLMWINENTHNHLLNHKEAIQKILDCLAKW